MISNIETAMQLVAEGLGIGFNREGYALRHMKYAKSVNYYGIDGREGKTDFVLAYCKDMPVMGVYAADDRYAAGTRQESAVVTTYKY